MPQAQTRTPPTRQRVVDAFVRLVRGSDYRDLSVADILGEAGVGRSTFYRYFSSKREVLVAMHERLMAPLLGELCQAEDWLAPEPPPSLIRLLERLEGGPRLRRSVAYRLGADLEPAARAMRRVLVERLHAQLARAFEGETLAVPLETLAVGISGIYFAQVGAWIEDYCAAEPAAVAATIHRMSRALVLDARYTSDSCPSCSSSVSTT